jgi:hypothetical protein
MSDERGEARMSSLITLVVLLLAGLGAWNVVPVYYANYSFQDKMVELARRPRYNSPDDEIMRLLQVEARDLKIDNFINPRTCRIATQDYRRTINCDYDRTVQIIPGWKYTFKFRNVADQPLI